MGIFGKLKNIYKTASVIVELENYNSTTEGRVVFMRLERMKILKDTDTSVYKIERDTAAKTVEKSRLLSDKAKELLLKKINEN